MKKIYSILLAMVCSVGMMWAADYAPTNVYTVGDNTTLGTQWASKNQTQDFATSGDYVVFNSYLCYQSQGNSPKQSWTGSVGNGSSSTDWTAEAPFQGSAAWGLNSYATTRDTRTYMFNVTNCLEVKALVKTGGSGRDIKLAAYEIVDGVVSETASAEATYTTNSVGVVTIEGLTAGNTYQIQINTNNTSNSHFYEIAFKMPAAEPHTVTFVAGDYCTCATASLSEVNAGDGVVLPAVTPAAGYDFLGWATSAEATTGSYQAGETYHPTADITLYAICEVHVDRYIVTYMDGANVMGTETVDAGNAPEGISTVKAHYAFQGWFANADCTGAAIDLASQTINADVTYYSKWVAAYSLSVDFAEEAAKADSLRTGIKALLDGAYYAYSIGSRGGYDTNALYTGYKMKDKSDYVEALLEAGQRITVTFGYVETGVIITANGDTLSHATSKTEETIFTYTTTAETALRIKNNSADGKTTTLKRIVIGDAPLVSDNAYLNAITVGGVALEGFSAGKLSYSIELENGTEAAPAVTATAADAEATVVIAATDSLPGVTTITVTAADGETQRIYTVAFSVAPVIGTEIIKATPTDANTADVEGVYAGEAFFNGQSSFKLGSNGHYVGVALNPQFAFEAADLIILNITSVNGANRLYFYGDAGTDSICAIDMELREGNNYIQMPTELVGHNQFYIYRVDSKCNPTIGFLGVYRVGADVPTGMDELNATDETIKFIENGQLVIIKNGVRYNALGQMLK